ncbi:MAG: hypothetical protein U9N13_08120 [Euryarchaeota archaeon]|nr:hypothetical protein [Euryarchaeota archaeon]
MKTKTFFFIFISLFILAPAAADEIVQLTDDTGSVISPQWSPDGEKIVYVTSHSWYQVEIWIIDSDGNNKQQITTGVSGFGFNKPWSPDSTKLVYSSLEYGLIPGIWIYDVHTEEKHKINGIKNINSYQWVFNGSNLFIVEEEDNTQKLWLVDSDGKNKTLLSTISGENTRFLWQPYGDQILYISNGSGNYDIWIMNPDGSGKKQLTSTTENEYAMGIDFSPDGNKIVYVSRNSFDRTNLSAFKGFSTTIWTMDADGANKKQLMAANESLDYYYPSWSPDGTKIAFEDRNDAGNRVNVVVMDADGLNLTILTANTGSGGFPQWSPKEDKIVFVSSEDGKMGISVANLDEDLASAPSTTVTSPPESTPEEAPGFSTAISVFTLFILSSSMTKRI